MTTDSDDPYDFDYVRLEKPEDIDSSSAVKGTLRQIEEAGATVKDIHPNHSVLFLGLVCPIVAEIGDLIKFRHGNIIITQKKSLVTKVLSSKQKR